MMVNTVASDFAVVFFQHLKNSLLLIFVTVSDNLCANLFIQERQDMSRRYLLTPLTRNDCYPAAEANSRKLYTPS
ncbi:hypothetical protein AHV57_25165 [Salmonella enterica]|nr:hypothetical protein [Salmonella enterica]EBA4670503.1 hypothetical protein [Salmonella enterica]